MSTTEQEARSKLRESFLQGVKKLCVLHDNSSPKSNPQRSCQNLTSFAKNHGFTQLQNVDRESCNILTYEQTVLTATFCGWQPDGSEILVRDMTTPANAVIPSALLRLPDVLAIQFEGPVQLP